MPTLPPDPRKAIRDPIHGLVPRSNEEIRLMNTVVFQRLRRIRQLAMAHLVYPGATHTRFEHCVGTMHVASLVCERLREFCRLDRGQQRRIRLAALLHDIGHGPFSHVGDYLFPLYADPAFRSQLTPERPAHELLTMRLVEENPEIAGILPQKDQRAIIDLLRSSKTRDFRRDIISSSLDADKLDYLQRDSYFAGVRYGHFDFNKVIDSCRVIRDGAQSFLALDHEGLYAFEQLVLGKYHMSQQVYYHRIRAITDAMIVRAVTLSLKAEDSVISRLYKRTDSSDFLDFYTSFDDDMLLRQLCESQHPLVRELADRLLHRRLLKRICKVRLDSVENAIVRDRLSRLESESAESRRLEETIAREVGGDPGLVIVSKWSVSNPTYRSVGHRLDEQETLILDEYGVPKTGAAFPDVSFALNKSQKSEESIQVYAPKESWNDLDADSTAERERYRTLVTGILIDSE